MRAVFLGLLACSWVGVFHAQLVSPSMLHWVTRGSGNNSEVYHIYYNFTSGYCGEYDDSQRVYTKEDLEIPGAQHQQNENMRPPGLEPTRARRGGKDTNKMNG